MNIRPLDLQILIPKTTDVGKNQQTLNQQPAVDQQHFTDQWRQISADRQHQVQSLIKSEGEKIHEEKHPKDTPKRSKPGRRGYTKKADDGGQDHQRIEGVSDCCGHIIDIKT